MTTGAVPAIFSRTGRPSVAVIYSIVDAWTRGQEFEHIADDETAETAAAITVALNSNGLTATAIPVRTLADVAAGLAEFDPATTVVFNLCEALGGTAGGENAIPPVLQSLGFNYVGGDGDNLARCQDKSLAKRLLGEAGLPTAPAQVMASAGEPRRLAFPLLVKPLREDSSVGIGPDSLVWDDVSLRRQVSHVIAVYRQPALAERFLRGREFYASLWEEGERPRLIAIGEGDYSSAPDPSLAFDHFESKWQNTYPAVYPARVDRALASRIEAISLAAYGALGCRHYARVDLREDGRDLYILEVNPNPALHPTAGFPRAAGVAGYTYGAMAAYLASLAWQSV